MTTYIIGDIHGGLKALKQVIRRVPLEADDRLIFLGDYVDGWSESSGVIGYLMQLEQEYKCIFIKGNHDAWCEEWLEGKNPDPYWLIHGGQASVDSYASIFGAERDRHIDFYNRMRMYHEEETPEGLKHLFVHAGFTSMHGPVREHHPESLCWDRTLWELAMAVDGRIGKEDPVYPKRLHLYDTVFIGHTPTTNYHIEIPMQRCDVWNVDTGAAFLGRITVMDIETKVFWQSDPVHSHYPREKGRNK